MTFIAPLISVTSGIVGALTDNPDAERFAKTEGWYRDALAGDESDACRLKYYSGRFGSHDCGTGLISGWATQPAKDYAYKLYNQYLAVKSGQLSPATPIPSPSTIPSVANTAATVSEVAGAVSQVAGAVAGQYGVPTTANTVTKAVETGKLILYGLLAALGVYVVYRVARRR